MPTPVLTNHIWSTWVVSGIQLYQTWPPPFHHPRGLETSVGGKGGATLVPLIQALYFNYTDAGTMFKPCTGRVRYRGTVASGPCVDTRPLLPEVQLSEDQAFWLRGVSAICFCWNYTTDVAGSAKYNGVGYENFKTWKLKNLYLLQWHNTLQSNHSSELTWGT